MSMVEDRADILLVNVMPDRAPALTWREYPWDTAKEELRAEARKRFGHETE